MANERKSGSASQLVRDLMTRNPECVSEKDGIAEVARIMKKEDTGVVPVVDGKKLIGMITDRDIVVRLVADGKDPLQCKVNEAMTKQVRSVREDASLNEVLEIMKGANVRRVPVCDANDNIVGIISMGDLSIGINQEGKVGDVVRNISEARPNN